jgi:NADH-quinone oxidoreductase subunit L
MTGPLVVLGILSLCGGWSFVSHRFLGEGFVGALEGIENGGGHGVVATLAILAFAAGTGLGFVLYSGRSKEPFRFAPLRDKLYFDEIYAALIAGTQELLATISRFIDQWIVDGILVRATSGAVWGIGFALRFLQFGNLQGYAFLFGLGVVATIYFLVFR